MLFAHQRLENTEYNGQVKNYTQWLKISGNSIDTPRERTAVGAEQLSCVKIPLIHFKTAYRKWLQERIRESWFRDTRINKNKNYGQYLGNKA